MSWAILALMFAPALIAIIRRHRSWLAITVLTVICVILALPFALFAVPGWLVALVWSFTGNVKPLQPWRLGYRRPSLSERERDLILADVERRIAEAGR